MFCEHYFQPKVKNIEIIKRHFHIFPFQDCFVSHLITLFLKYFLVLKPAFEKSSKENSKQISKNNQIISTCTLRFLHKK